MLFRSRALSEHADQMMASVDALRPLVGSAVEADDEAAPAAEFQPSSSSRGRSTSGNPMSDTDGRGNRRPRHVSASPASP